MTDAREVICRPLRTRPLRFLAGLGAAGAILAAVRMAYWGGFVDVWAYAGLLVALVGLGCLHAVTARVSADAYGLHSRTLLRRRSVPWRDIADLRVYVQYGRYQETRRVSTVLRDGHKRRLPLPLSGSFDDRPNPTTRARRSASRLPRPIWSASSASWALRRPLQTP